MMGHTSTSVILRRVFMPESIARFDCLATKKRQCQVDSDGPTLWVLVVW
jgi:hypothetical protein